MSQIFSVPKTMEVEILKEALDVSRVNPSFQLPGTIASRVRHEGSGRYVRGSPVRT
jgi:hypothetical protein